MAEPNLSRNEVKVLAALASVGDDYCLPFKAIARRVRLSRPIIRRACRSLTRKGLAHFSRGLWNEDGGPAGSGYGVTVAGATAADAKLVDKIITRMWD